MALFRVQAGAQNMFSLADDVVRTAHDERVRTVHDLGVFAVIGQIGQEMLHAVQPGPLLVV